MSEPKIAIGCVANLYSRQMYFEHAGDIEVGHTHAFDHLSLLAYGKIKCVVDNVESEFEAPCMIYIKKDKIHEFIALQNQTVIYCIHALRNGCKVEDIIDPAMIPNGVNALDIAEPLLEVR